VSGLKIIWAEPGKRRVAERNHLPPRKPEALNRRHQIVEKWGGGLMVFLVYELCKLSFKLFAWMMMLSIWLMMAMIVIPAAVIASATGNQRAARQWQRSLRWRWRF
jgi:hypothetical protein